MKTFDNQLYSPSQTWNEYLHNLLWGPDTQTDSISQVFREAIRRGISKSDAFFDVAEQIHRSFCPVNWGVLHWRWKQILTEWNQAHSPIVPVSARKALQPLSSENSRNDKPFVIQPKHAWNGQQNCKSQTREPSAQYPQRRAASLASYYE